MRLGDFPFLDFFRSTGSIAPVRFKERSERTSLARFTLFMVVLTGAVAAWFYLMWQAWGWFIRLQCYR